MCQDGQKCPICCEGVLEKNVLKETFEYKGSKTVVPDYVIFSCPVCEETIVSEETLKSTEKTIRDFHRSVDGLLTSEQIKKGRQALGFNQDAFAAVLGVGAKNFSRYENGKVTQSKSMDNLLRIVYEYPFTLDAISDHRWVFESVQSVSYSTRPSDNLVVYDFEAMKGLRANGQV